GAVVRVVVHGQVLVGPCSWCALVGVCKSRARNPIHFLDHNEARIPDFKLSSGKIELTRRLGSVGVCKTRARNATHLEECSVASFFATIRSFRLFPFGLPRL